MPYNFTRPRRSKGSGTVSPRASTPLKKPSPWYDKLYPEQVKAAEFVLSRPATALFCKPGVGKTFITMAVLERLEWRHVLIIAPLTSLGVTWYPKLTTLPDTKVAQELEVSLKSFRRVNHRQIVLTNPEGLRRRLRSIRKYPWDLVVWDESQNIKNRSSINSRLARRLRHVPRRLALSGTPMDTGQIDIWAQMRFVDYEVFGEAWKDFANLYCYKTGWMNKEWVFSPKMNAQFLRQLEPYVMRLSDNFLKLEPIKVIPVPVELLGRQRRIYETMHKDSFIGLDGWPIPGNNQGARDKKLEQITGGAVLDEQGVAHFTGRAKERKLSFLLQCLELETPVVIFCQFLHEIDIILKLIPNASVIRGQIKGTDRTKIIDDFQAGKIDYLICQVRTASESISLTRAKHLILYSMTYSYINFEQTLRRLHRGGQTDQVTAYILFCVSTIDEDKLNLVQDKSETSAEVLAHFEE